MRGDGTAASLERPLIRVEGIAATAGAALWSEEGEGGAPNAELASWTTLLSDVAAAGLQSVQQPHPCLLVECGGVVGADHGDGQREDQYA